MKDLKLNGVDTPFIPEVREYPYLDSVLQKKLALNEKQCGEEFEIKIKCKVVSKEKSIRTTENTQDINEFAFIEMRAAEVIE